MIQLHTGEHTVHSFQSGSSHPFSTSPRWAQRHHTSHSSRAGTVSTQTWIFIQIVPVTPPVWGLYSCSSHYNIHAVVYTPRDCSQSIAYLVLIIVDSQFLHCLIHRLIIQHNYPTATICTNWRHISPSSASAPVWNVCWSGMYDLLPFVFRYIARGLHILACNPTPGVAVECMGLIGILDIVISDVNTSSMECDGTFQLRRWLFSIHKPDLRTLLLPYSVPGHQWDSQMRLVPLPLARGVLQGPGWAMVPTMNPCTPSMLKH